MTPSISVVNGQFTVTDTETGQSIGGFDTVDCQIDSAGKPLLQFGVYQFHTATFLAPGPTPPGQSAPTPTPAPAASVTTAPAPVVTPTPTPNPTAT